MGSADDPAERPTRRPRLGLWAARLVLVPGAVATIVLIAWGIGVPKLRTLWPFLTVHQPPPLDAGLLERMTDDQRLLVLGDTGAATDAEAQRAIAQRWPDDPACRAHAVAAHLAAHIDQMPPLSCWGMPSLFSRGEDDEPPSREMIDARLAEAVAELDRAAEAEPDNALYPLLRSILRINVCSEGRFYSVWRPNRTHLPYVLTNDDRLFAQGLDDLRLAASRPHCSTHQADMVRLRLEAIPPPTRLLDALTVTWRVEEDVVGNWDWLHFQYWNWAWIVLSYAQQLAVEGRCEEALQWNHAVQRVNAAWGAGSQTISEVSLVCDVYGHTAQNEADIYETMGRSDWVAAINRRAEDVAKLHSEAEPRTFMRTEAARRVGISGVTGWVTEVDPAPLRAAEYALLEQAALILLLMYFPWIALPGPGDLRALWRGTPRSCVLFIGWKRLGRILLYGAVAPLAAYAACTRLAPFSSHRYGLWYTSTRVVLELTVVDTVMIGLLWVMTYKAVRQRAAEAGIAVPPPIGLRDRAAFAALAEALALAVIGYLALWEWVMPGDNRMLAVFVGIGLSEAIILLGAAWLMREAIFMFRRRKTFASFYLTLSRSGLGVLAAAAILVGALAGTALRHAEAANVAHLAGTAGTGLHNEVERTTARHTRAWFVDYHKRLRAGEGELERAIGQ